MCGGRQQGRETAREQSTEIFLLTCLGLFFEGVLVLSARSFRIQWFSARLISLDQQSLGRSSITSRVAGLNLLMA